ncbi:paraquat-inducible protein A [Geminicoccaceae bacterium 1502E]|nr:paraquat-inducible protein A [Geminicoccaceae bacterium 1502E]
MAAGTKTEGQEAVGACHECGTLHAQPAAGAHAVARCPICRAELYREHPQALDRALAFGLAATVLFAAAHVFPFMSMSFQGREQVMTLLSGVEALYREGMAPLALLVLLTATVIPGIKLATGLYVLLPLRFGRCKPAGGAIFRLIEELRPWAMMEVYLLGVIVAYVKLGDLAMLRPDVGLWAFVALILCMIGADASMDERLVWYRLAPQRLLSALAAAPPAVLAACHDCGQIERLDGGRTRCSRCNAALHKRKPQSLQRTTALLVTAAILYVPANLFPVMTVISLGRGEADTILSGVSALAQAGMWPIALLVFFASILVPLLKLIGLSYLLISTRWRAPRNLRQRTLLYRIIERIGRWSMVDIFMIAILVALVQIGSIATVLPGPGALAFAGVVILTMIASRSFDPRLMWDRAERSGHAIPYTRI